MDEEIHDREGRKRLASDEHAKVQLEIASRRRLRSVDDIDESKGDRQPLTKREREEAWPIG
jgi:hypothetical protein